MVDIAVIGGSFGGVNAALELARLLKGKARITLFCDMDQFVFIPSLPWLSLGWRTAEDITLPLKEVLEPRGIVFRHEAVTRVDADANQVITASGAHPYDYLVVATGPELAFGETPGFDPALGRVECIFTLDQAQRAKVAWERFLENPGPIAVGAVAGVSCFGPAYEYAFELHAALRARGLRSKVPIHFITSEQYLGHFGIGGFGASKRWLEDEFAVRDIKHLTGQWVEEFAPGEVRLKGGEKIPYKLAMFAPPMKGVAAVAHLGNPRGFIPVDGLMRAKAKPNIFCVGVAVAIAPPEATQPPTGVPKTGYMTARMALTAARAIAAEVSGKAPPPPYEMDVLCMMDLGDTAAYLHARPLLPPRDSVTVKVGRWARWMKIAFERYYLFKTRRGLARW